MDVMEKANTLATSGMDIIHLEVGEPDFDTPECIRIAAVNAMHKGRTHYTDSLGIPELRHTLKDHYLKTYGVTIDASQALAVGHFVEVGTPEHFFTAPEHERTKGFLSKIL